MAKNLPAEAQAPWHPCDDGLIPMAEALERCSKASVQDLPERIRYSSTSPIAALATEINGRDNLASYLTSPPRVEMVRRWLQTNGFAPDAAELKTRWKKICRRFERWEQAARKDIAPPGSKAMFCSESTCKGYYRVVDLIDDLADWCRQLAWMLKPRLKSAQQPEPATETARPKKSQGQKKQRSWTQPELDAAIRACIVKYSDLLTNARKGKAGARREVQKVFGRNAIAQHLGVKSARMVSVSKPWLELAEAVGLPRKSCRRGMSRVGLPIALEQRADADDSNVLTDVSRRETTEMIEAEIRSAKGNEQKAGFTDLLEKFNRGQVTDDQAREIVETLRGE